MPSWNPCWTWLRLAHRSQDQLTQSVRLQFVGDSAQGKPGLWQPGLLTSERWARCSQGSESSSTSRTSTLRNSRRSHCSSARSWRPGMWGRLNATWIKSAGHLQSLSSGSTVKPSEIHGVQDKGLVGKREKSKPTSNPLFGFTYRRRPLHKRRPSAPSLYKIIPFECRRILRFEFLHRVWTEKHPASKMSCILVDLYWNPIQCLVSRLLPSQGYDRPTGK